MKFCYSQILPFLNNPKNLDLSYKMNLDFWDCFEGKNSSPITKEIRYIISAFTQIYVIIYFWN